MAVSELFLLFLPFRAMQSSRNGQPESPERPCRIADKHKLGLWHDSTMVILVSCKTSHNCWPYLYFISLPLTYKEYWWRIISCRGYNSTKDFCLVKQLKQRTYSECYHDADQRELETNTKPTTAERASGLSLALSLTSLRSLIVLSCNHRTMISTYNTHTHTHNWFFNTN